MPTYRTLNDAFMMGPLSSRPAAGSRGRMYYAEDEGNEALFKDDGTQWKTLLLARLNSPDFSGVPTAPTAAPGTATRQIATTEFISLALAAFRETLLGGAGPAIDTLKELGDLLAAAEEGDEIAVLTTALSGKLAKSANLGDLLDPAAARSNLGLGNVNNTADADKPISTATATALAGKADAAATTSALAAKADAAATTTALAGKADLVGGVIPTAQIPSVALVEFLGESASEAEMLAKTGQPGDWTIRTDEPGTWVITGPDPTLLANWTGLLSPVAAASGVLTINGLPGPNPVLGKGDIGLGNVPNVDATNRNNHTGQQLAATISDFEAAVYARVAAILQVDGEMTKTPDAGAGTITLAYVGGDGGDGGSGGFWPFSGPTGAPPAASGWTRQGGHTATIEDIAEGMRLVSQTPAVNAQQAQPFTIPFPAGTFDLVIGALVDTRYYNYASLGVGFMNLSTQQIVAMDNPYDNGSNGQSYIRPHTWNFDSGTGRWNSAGFWGGIVGVSWPGIRFFRIRNEGGGTYEFLMSWNGTGWHSLAYSGGFPASPALCLYVNPANAANVVTARIVVYKYL